MCTYLSKRVATYYFRRSIPVELRPALGGKLEFTVSLRTKDREIAKRLIPAETTKSQRLLDEAALETARQRPADPRQKPFQQSTAYEAAAWEAGLEMAEIDFLEIAEKEARREEVAEYIAFLTDRISGSTKEMPRGLRAITYMIEAGEFDRKVLREHLAIARAEKSALELRIDAQPPITIRASVSDGEVMLDTTVIDLWAAERKAVPKGKDTYRAVATSFYGRVGRKPVVDIVRQDVLAYKASLIKEGQGLSNIKTKLSRLRTLLQWATDNDLTPANVAIGITVKDTDAARNKRREFDLPALTSIFSSVVYSNGVRPAGGKGEAAYWLPLLALFTGARLEELGQLRIADVREERYPDDNGAERSSWFIRIMEDERDGLTIKNAASERKVPVHQSLIALGFLNMVLAAKEAGHDRLFPALRANIYGRLTAKWGEWFSQYKRTVCGITDKRMVFHSFRHTFKHYARHASIIEGVQRQIMGHSSSDVADSYGSGYTTFQLVEGMNLFKVPGLTLPAAPAMA